jgi:hypothetical protein
VRDRPLPPICDVRSRDLNVRSTSIVLKNPRIGHSSKNHFVLAIAWFDCGRPYGDATELAGKPRLVLAGFPAKISQRASVAATNVIEPKIGVFQHNPSTPAVRLTSTREVQSAPLWPPQVIGFRQVDHDVRTALGGQEGSRVPKVPRCRYLH